MHRKTMKTNSIILFLAALLLVLGTAGGAQDTLDTKAGCLAKIKELIPTLSDEDISKRHPARVALHQMSVNSGRPDAENERLAMCQALVACLEAKETSQAARVSIVRALERIGREESVAALAELLACDDIELRDCARRALQKSSAAQATQPLIDALNKADSPIFKAGLINALATRGVEQCVPKFVSLLDDDNALVASAATEALADLATPAAIEALLGALDKAKGPRHAALAHAALRTGSLAACEKLIAETEPVNIRIAAMNGLAAQDTKKAEAVLAEAISGDNPKMQTAAIQTIAGNSTKELTDVLAKALKNLPPSAQTQALGALAGLKPPRRRAAIRLTTSEDESVRLAAISALGKMGGEVSVDALLELVAKADGSTRDAVVTALASVAGEGVDDKIAAAAGPDSTSNRVAAIEVLAARRAVETVPKLLEYAAEEDRAVSTASFDALAEIANCQALSKVLTLITEAKNDDARADATDTFKTVCRKYDRAVKPYDAIFNTLEKKVVADLASVDAATKTSLLTVLPAIGGGDALRAVCAAMRDEATRDTAVRSLAIWPEFAATQPLLMVAGLDQGEEVHRVLAMRGAMRLVAAATDTPAKDRVAICAAAMKAAGRVDEKKLVLSTLGKIAAPEAAEAIKPYLAEAALRAEAGLAAVALAEALASSDAETAKDLARQVLASDVADDVKKRADDVVNGRSGGRRNRR